MAAHQKKTRDLHASLIFTDESGFLLAPLLRRTLAPVGCTPLLRQRARHRDKISVAAALTLSPARGHVGLYYQSFVDAYVNATIYAQFLRRQVLARVRRPLVVVQDQGSMHKGPVLRGLVQDVRRLDLNMLPPYAPELNPVEQLWNHAKDKELCNFAPADVKELNGAVCDCLESARKDQPRLRSFFAATPLPWDGLTVYF
jgi:putative transposase